MSQAGQTLLLTSVTNYFDKKNDLKKCLYDIVNSRSVLSLRVIDWFITHYTKERNTIFWVDDKNGKLVETFPATGGNNLRKVHLYLDYRAQLKSYTKLNFDPFRRHNRISFVIDTGDHIVLETTIGQLNFFRWCFQNHIIEYICNHLTEIEKFMARHIHDKKGTGGNNEVVKVQETTPKLIRNNRKTACLRKSNANTDIIAAPCCLHFT
jgi:hypothetical protein